MRDHALGPFCVEDVNSYDLHDICLDYKVPGWGRPILIGHVMFDEDGDGPITRHQATRIATRIARMFAASPDMLIALKFILAHECSDSPCMTCASAAELAIAKAERQRE